MLSLLSVFGKSSRVFVSGPHIQRSPRSDLRFALTKSLFCCVFGLMEERLELPRQLAKRRKAGCQDSGLRSKRRSWAILERRFHALTWDFSNLSFSPGRPALEWSKSARPLSQTFGKKKAGRATVTLRGLPDDSGQSDRCGRVCPALLPFIPGDWNYGLPLKTTERLRPLKRLPLRNPLMVSLASG